MKPANIMIDRRGEPIVMDFGLARRVSRDETRLTQSGSAIGTPAYMPPEQISSNAEGATPASDIYSLGVIMYELLTGRLPFKGDVMAMLAQILTEEPPRPSSLKPAIDPSLEAICLKAMAKNPAERFKSMSEFANQLLVFLRGEGPPPLPPTETFHPEAKETQASGIRMSMLGGLRSMAQAGMQVAKPQPLTKTAKQPRLKPKRKKLPGWAYMAMGGGAVAVLVAVIALVWSLSGNTTAKVIFTTHDATTSAALTIASESKDPLPTKPTDKVPSEPERNLPTAPTMPLLVENAGLGAGWVSLFNGKDFSGWREVGGKGGWWVKENVLFVDRGPPGARQSGWLMTEREYSDFELRLEFAIGQRADSGVAFRCDPSRTHPLGQAEIQIVDEQDPEFTRTLDMVPFRRTGSLCPLAADRTVPSLERDRWNTMTVELRGRNLKVTVNEVVTVNTDLDVHVNEASKGEGRPGIWRKSGPIALQKMAGATGIARFRNILIKELPSPASGLSAQQGVRVALSQAELVALRELPPNQNKSGPWLSPDGLSLYWTDKQGEIHSIWRASRTALGESFTNATRILGGHDITLSKDLTELIRVDYDPQPQRGQKFALFSARKKAASDREFLRPHRKLTEMAGLGFVCAPCLSDDGLTLYAEQFGDSSLPPNVRFRRNSPDAPWGRPEAVPLSGLTKSHLRFSFISPDNRFLFGNNDDSPSGMLVLTSFDGGRTFGSPKPIEIPGNVVKGKFPRYCTATKELIFSEVTTAKAAELFLIRNFDPDAIAVR